MSQPLRIAAAISLCAWCLMVSCGDAAPSAKTPAEIAATTIVTDSTEEGAIEFLHKTFYSNAEFTDKGKRVRSLIREEIKRIGFNFASIANRTLEDWQYIVRSLFMSYYLKQKSMSERVTNLLYESLGIREQDKPKISKRERADILSRIPAAVISRVDKWNERPFARKFEDVVFIGAPKIAEPNRTAWSFTLEKPMASRKILNLKLGIHLTPESRERVTGLVLNVRHAVNLGIHATAASLKKLHVAGRVTVDPLAVSLSEEIQVDVTEMIKPRIYGMRDKKDGKRLELFFFVECPDCGENPFDVTYMVMDCKVRVGGELTAAGDDTLLSREVREAERLQWPFDNTTATEVFKNHPPGATFTKTQMCIIENVNRRYGQKSCCLMEFTYDMSHQGVVLAPKQLRISYCAGECHGQSQVHTPHSSLLQIVGHSQTSKLSHETKEDINLCCVANTYRDFQVLTVGRPPADSTKTSVQLKVIKDISAESCTCA